MKKYNIKGYVISGLVGASLMFSVQGFAAVGDRVEAIFAEFNFVINGKPVTLSETPLVYNGTSYLPVRSLSNALGLDVTYKADSRTIELNSGTVGGSVYGIPVTVPQPTTQPTVTPSPTMSPSPTTSTPSPILTSSNGVNFQMLKNYYSNADSSPAIQINGKIYVAVRDGAEHYKTYDVSWDEQTKNVVFSKSLIRIPISQTFGEYEGFVYQGTTYVKESYFVNFK